MVLGTYIMLGVCLIWFGLFIRFVTIDLRNESKKSALVSKGESLDPFLFTGEKAREEAREIYQNDPVVQAYFDETRITPFLEKSSKEE